MDLNDLWEKVLGELELEISKANFTTWFRGTKLLAENDGIVVIGVPNSFSKEWLENKYRRQIVMRLGKYIPNLKQIVVEIGTSAPKKVSVGTVSLDEIKSDKKQKQEFSSNLNPNHIFDSFVVGNNNRLAHATSQAVANKPGELYNPLFIYGGVGLGKTHLIQAIGNDIKNKFPDKKILYVSCENFTNEFIGSISTGRIKEFKKKYRNIDVFLVDDIQFLSHKEGTQEEFFHTFNALHQSNRQIVITSDRVPKAIPELEGRLSSRFGWGMVADIQPPNLETRIAILKAKANAKNIQLKDEVIQYLAQNIISNIRELEGALTKIMSYIQLYEEDLNISSVKELMKDLVDKSQKNSSTPDVIIKVVCKFFNISREELMGKKRIKDLVYPRQLTMYMLRHELNMSYPLIGREMGGKDHTTIIYGVEKITKGAARNEGIKSDLSSIRELIYVGM